MQLSGPDSIISLGVRGRGGGVVGRGSKDNNYEVLSYHVTNEKSLQTKHPFSRLFLLHEWSSRKDSLVSKKMKMLS